MATCTMGILPTAHLSILPKLALRISTTASSIKKPVLLVLFALKARFVLVPAAILLAIGYYFWIKLTVEPFATDDAVTSLHYASRSVLKHPFTNIFAFVTVLAIFSIARKYLNFSNAFSRFMTKANFGYYALHLFVLVPLAFVWCEIVKLPIWACYLANASSMIVVTTALYLILSKIPVVRTLMLGMK